MANLWESPDETTVHGPVRGPARRVPGPDRGE